MRLVSAARSRWRSVNSPAFGEDGDPNGAASRYTPFQFYLGNDRETATGTLRRFPGDGKDVAGTNQGLGCSLAKRLAGNLVISGEISRCRHRVPVYRGDSVSDPASTDPREETPLCPHCLAEIESIAHFCSGCGGPISSIAMMDPLGSIHARGFAFGKATSGTSRPIVLVGMWLICIPEAVICFWFGFWNMYSIVWQGLFDFAGLAESAVALLGGGIFVAILYRTTRNFHYAPRVTEPDDDTDANTANTGSDGDLG
jgi:hypothetical protein